MLNRVGKKSNISVAIQKKTCRVLKRNEFNNMLWPPLKLVSRRGHQRTNRQTGQEQIQFNYKIPHPSM